MFLILAAHEIRDDAERVQFFREVKRLLAPGGRILTHTQFLNHFILQSDGTPA